MKIVFIEPRVAAANVYSGLRMPLLGPVYLGTILRDRGHEVEIYNENVCEPDYPAIDADFIGISILTANAKRGYEIASHFPREKVVMGGVHASLMPEEAGRFCRQVVVGEAEGVICDIVEGRLTDPVVYGRPVADLDTLPFPDFSLIRGGADWPVIPVSTSRGCPYDCSFCSVTAMFGRTYRFRSTGKVMEELARLGRREVFFCDDNFCANTPRSLELAKMLKSSRIPGWSCQVRCDAAAKEGLLDAFSAAGCRLVCVGLESVNDKTLARFDKRQTVEEVSSAIRQFHLHGIRVHGMFVLGGDDDSAGTVWDTLRFAVRHRLDTLQMSILTPFPRTKIRRILNEEKRIFTDDWDLYDGQHVVFTPKLLSPKDLQKNVLEAYSAFYSLPNSLRLVFSLRIRNAFFRLMGYSIVKRWQKLNRGFAWLPV